MTKNIKVQCNIDFKDYLSYCFFPTNKKRTLWMFLVITIIAGLVAIGIILLSILNKDVINQILFPYLVFIVVYLTILIMTYVSIHSSYKKNKKAFTKDLVYSFLNNKMTISLPEKQEETIDVFIEKIYSYKETKKKAFITLSNGKYYMIDKNKFIEGNLVDLREWAIKHIKVIKMASN